jgi:hypothetical protein
VTDGRRAALLVVALALAGCGGGGENQKADVLPLAKQAFEQAKANGVDLSRGPCLGVIAKGWVADVAHDPRQPVDDLPENQCEAFRSGEAEHFVELDPNGDVIRTG